MIIAPLIQVCSPTVGAFISGSGTHFLRASDQLKADFCPRQNSLSAAFFWPFQHLLRRLRLWLQVTKNIFVIRQPHKKPTLRRSLAELMGEDRRLCSR